MKYTDRELDRLLEKLIASTRSAQRKILGSGKLSDIRETIAASGTSPLLFTHLVGSSCHRFALLHRMEHLLLSETCRLTDNFHTGRYADHQTARRNGSDAEPFPRHSPIPKSLRENTGK